jgi:hypothetical protein
MILSIDVGIKNLAMCVMECEDKTILDTFKIHLWETYNILQPDDDKTCTSIQKNGKICNKKCLYKYKHENDFIYSCKTHFPSSTITLSKEHHIKKKLVNDFLLQDIATLFITKIKTIYEENIQIFTNLTHIVVELQPKINQKMKFISHVLYGKLVELYMGTNVPIRFVRASQKLKAYTGPVLECTLKGAYAKRKWLSIQYSIWFLENKFNTEQKNRWLPILLNSKKSDDLTDTFLMAINTLHGLPKRQTKDKNGKCIK